MPFLFKNEGKKKHQKMSNYTEKDAYVQKQIKRHPKLLCD